ncbi:DUF4097 family beta strand repeat-containing protein [Nocardioides massiliensis]|uniref:DUF4097 domain-containing protein n=1 Tax=Nocardioides massiliensis TaxID=1325935 RepID=A0ABT9NM52_9ACTN|nr:DUF4097 family beta strand repeat-containing protein [Nocardioides massiliensis]MDP9821497.1 hypothetical protein [Nocardioides massiliensis]
MTEHHSFPGAHPRDLVVEIGAGDLTIRLDPDAVGTEVVLDGPTEDVEVEETDDAVRVVQRRRRIGFLSRGLDVTITAPAGSRPDVQTGSADVVVTGPAGTTSVRVGSADARVETVDGDADLVSGSGDITVAHVSGRLHARSGSGDLRIGRAAGPVTLSTGSGDASLDQADADVTAKSGSGNLVIGHAAEVRFTTASGDLHITRIDAGSVTSKSAAGDVRVGVGAGTPVWTEIDTLTGSVRNDLQSLGAPTDGQPYVQIHATTISGDVHLRHV